LDPLPHRAPANPATETNADTPPVIEAIILKLLAKAAEDRYQTILALEADFRHCLDQILAYGHIDPFEIAASDRADGLCIPDHLYGRTEQVEDY
jgi:hypothetical protein